MESRHGDEDPPVQGPLPYEPDDAPWKKPSDSGIRKLYVNGTKKKKILLFQLKYFFLFSVFVNYFLNHVQQAFHVVPCHPSLKWLCLLVLVANLPFEHILYRKRLTKVTINSSSSALTMTNTELAHSNLPQYFNKEIKLREMWIIK